MKKITALVLAILMLSVLAGCVDYSKCQFDFLEDDFSWDMTIDDAVKYVEDRQDVLKSGAEVTDYDSFISVSDRYYTFHFNVDGKLEYVKYRVYGNGRMYNNLVERYGEPYEYDDDYRLYRWYGTMDGRNTEMRLTSYPDTWVEFELA